MKRPLIFILFFSIFCAGFLKGASEAGFVGSIKSNKYHYLTCRYAREIIADDNKRRRGIAEGTGLRAEDIPKGYLEFKTPEIADKMGYKPCKLCKPPQASIENKTDNDNRIMIANKEEIK